MIAERDAKGRITKQAPCSNPWAWRPSSMTEEVVKKLLDAFSYSFTDDEACLYAWISKPTLYEYCKVHPEFTDQKEQLKKKPNLKAKMNKVKAINEGNLVESWWWLERKSRDEFSLKQEIDNNISWTLWTIDISKMTAIERLEYIKSKCK